MGLLIILHVIYEDSHGGMILTGKRKELGELTPSATSSTTNPTWNDLGANPGLCGERPTTNRLSHGTTFFQFLLGEQKIRHKLSSTATQIYFTKSKQYWMTKRTTRCRGHDTASYVEGSQFGSRLETHLATEDVNFLSVPDGLVIW
jgi:hypothetical protein